MHDHALCPRCGERNPRSSDKQPWCDRCTEEWSRKVAPKEAHVGKQTRIKGTEPTTFPDVNKAAEDFLELRQAAINAADAKRRGPEDLVRVMKKHNLRVYRDPDANLEIVLDGKDVVKVHKPKKKRKRGRRQ